MKNLKNIIFYIGITGGFLLLIYWIVLQGQILEANKINTPAAYTQTSNWKHFTESLIQRLKHPFAILLVQIISIIIAARVFGYLFKKIKQPTVIGELVGGIFLGPSVLGWLFPEFSSALFPVHTLGNLQFLSQIGLILFMFIIGMELDLKVLKTKAYNVIVISHASIIIPFALGMGLAYFIYQTFATNNAKFLTFGLFMGTAVSITAFPVLARILQERGISKTRLGTLIISCAAINDITGWCILVAIIAIVKAGSFISSVYTIMLAVVYVVFMLILMQPFLKRMGSIYSSKETLSKPIIAAFFLILFLSAYITEIIGIHTLFGAFMAGVIMPENIRFKSIFIEKVETVALVLLLPLFFVFTGLRTQIGLLNNGYLWLICGIIILVAITGKLIGSTLAAKFVGQNWPESLTIGTLMNTRGLMELVVLNIGYDLGVLTPEVFAMMVIMALVTTFMTGPALNLINNLFPEIPKLEAIPQFIIEKDKYNILLFSFGNPEKGKTMLRLVNGLIRKSKDNSTITILHLSPSNDMYLYNEEEYEKESFNPVTIEAESLHLPTRTIFKPSQDISKEIIETANKGNYNLLLIGKGQSVFTGTLLGKILNVSTKIISPEKLIDSISGKDKLFDEDEFDDMVRKITRGTQIPVGILIDKNLKKVENVFIPIFSPADSFLLLYAQKLIINNDSYITILDPTRVISQNAEFKENILIIEQVAPNHIALYVKNIEEELFEQQDMMLISLNSWKKLIKTQSPWLTHAPSILIIKS